MEIQCGCSGYHYDEWKEKFYPKELAKDKWLDFYAEHFNLLEINNTFYQLPEKSTVKFWYDHTPLAFKFSVKGSQYITHQKKLKLDDDLKEAVENFHKRVRYLGNKLEIILWQLPGNLHVDQQKLDKFCKLLDKKNRHVFEFRHASWFDDEVMDLLKAHDVACCAISSPDEELPEDIKETTDFVYIRMHGKKEWYNYDYDGRELNGWLRKIRNTQASEAFILFNNTAHHHAVENGKKLQQMLQ